MDAIVVRRGMRPEYYNFMEITSRVNGGELVLDRRLDERRRTPGAVAPERRTTERRGPPPPSWIKDGVILLRGRATRLIGRRPSLATRWNTWIAGRLSAISSVWKRRHPPTV